MLRVRPSYSYQHNQKASTEARKGCRKGKHIIKVQINRFSFTFLIGSVLTNRITGKTSGWEPQLSHSSPKGGVTKEEGAIILYLSFSRHLYFPFDTEEDNLASIRFPNEYSHFQVTCPECGKELPPNTLKRHIAKHKKTKEQTKAPGTPNDQVVLYAQVHFLFKLYLNVHFQGLADERIPCSQCGKMLPKNAMKRHLMKHETTGQV